MPGTIARVDTVQIDLFVWLLVLLGCIKLLVSDFCPRACLWNGFPFFVEI
jgi:hypothetical protein